MSINRFITAGLLLCSSQAYCNTASTEFVRASIDTLRNELSPQLKTLSTSLNSVQQQVKELPLLIHAIGEIYQGGIVFWLDVTKQHGLIAALTDIQEEVTWHNGEAGDKIVNAKAQGLGAGETNTRLIIAQQTIDQQDGQFAALLAANYQTQANGKPCLNPLVATKPCYAGWYLPSTYELLLLHHNLKNTNLGQFADEPYWSSSEEDTTTAWLVHFGSGEARPEDKATLAHVRPIRSF